MTQENLFHCVRSWKSLLEHLLIKTASVRFGVRPAALLRLSRCRYLRERGHYDSFCRHKREILEKLKLDCLILSGNATDIQVLFYDREQLRNHLEQPENKTFLAGLGYRSGGTLEEHLAELKRRFKHSEFPHEIGLFLGYPLKDVKGFIEGRTDGALFAGSMWRVFGDPAESVDMMTRCRRAEQLVAEAVGKCDEGIAQEIAI